MTKELALVVSLDSKEATAHGFPAPKKYICLICQEVVLLEPKQSRSRVGSWSHIICSNNMIVNIFSRSSILSHPYSRKLPNKISLRHINQSLS